MREPVLIADISLGLLIQQIAISVSAILLLVVAGSVFAGPTYCRQSE